VHLQRLSSLCELRVAFAFFAFTILFENAKAAILNGELRMENAV